MNKQNKTKQDNNIGSDLKAQEQEQNKNKETRTRTKEQGVKT
jgi:hypothetical protein